MMSCLNVDETTVANATTESSDTLTKNLPKEIDWRTRGYITPVKDQVSWVISHMTDTYLITVNSHLEPDSETPIQTKLKRSNSLALSPFIHSLIFLYFSNFLSASVFVCLRLCLCASG